MTSEDLQNPFILQCKKCKTTIADSFSLLDYKKNYLVLKAVTHSIKTDTKRKTSSDEADIDCYYFDLICECRGIVGRKYLTVTKECSSFVGRYCVFKGAVFSYMLGCTEGASEVTLSEVCEEIAKIQRFCAYLHDRIEK